METDRIVRSPADWPVYWFAVLEKAVEKGDHQLAAAAQCQLQRLGVRVKYGRPATTPSAERQEVARG